MSRILVVEDDLALCEALKKALTEHKFSVDIVNDGVTALDWLSQNTYDVVILDWLLPGMSGQQVCYSYRQSSGSAPIIMLTARSALQDKVEGLGCGADDYLVKPFDIEELLARIGSLLRRPPEMKKSDITIGCVKVNFQCNAVVVKGTTLDLRRREYQILELLAKNRGHIFSAEQIIERLWPTDSDCNPEVVRCHVNRLRQKIGMHSKEAKSLITTVYGLGYKIPE